MGSNDFKTDILMNKRFPVLFPSHSDSYFILKDPHAKNQDDFIILEIPKMGIEKYEMED